MIFGGIQKNSFIDYPGRISCVLFFNGCNFTCPYCHNPSLVRGESINPITEQAAYAFLESRRGLLEGVVLSGGEPTLAGNILQICREIKAMGYRVKLDTNGSRPTILKRLIAENLVDYVAMDVKTDPEKYMPPLAPKGTGAKVLASIELLKTAPIPYEFRTTCVAPFISHATMTRIGHWLKGARKYFLQPFRPDTVLTPGFFKDSFSAVYDLEELRSSISALVPTCQVRS